MEEKFTEGVIDNAYRLAPGDIIVSPGGTLQYTVLSYPCCRIYWQYYADPDLSPVMRDRLESRGLFTATPESHRVAPTPWMTESAWIYREGDWKRNGANYPSYLVVANTSGKSEPFYLTLRWKPEKYV